jgi:hypothetical protein
MNDTEDEKQTNGGKRAYTINQFCSRYAVGRTKFYEEKNAGRLRVRSVGRRNIITADDAEAWLENLPAA